MANWEKTLCKKCTYPIYYLKKWKKLPRCKSCYLFNLDLKNIVNHLGKLNKNNKSKEKQSVFLELKDLIIRYGKNRNFLCQKIANNKKVYTLIKETDKNLVTTSIELPNKNKERKIKKVKHTSFIQKNFNEIAKQHRISTLKLKRLNQIKKAKYCWLKYKIPFNFDTISLEDLTGLSDRQQIEFETEIEKDSNFNFHKYFQNLHEREYHISDFDIEKQKNLSISRRSYQKIKQTEQSNETYIDYLKKGANLYEN